MATFQPPYGTLGDASYQIEAENYDNKLEPFLWKLLLLSALAYFIWTDAISIGIGPVSIDKMERQAHVEQQKTNLFGLLGFCDEKKGSGIKLEEEALDNLTFVIDPTYAGRFAVPKEQVQDSWQRCALFVKRFSPVAVAEMRRYGVPASILLAQALLASNAGDDPICRETNNFFFRACQQRSCNAAHFSDLASDDDHAAVIDVYSNLWGSFRAQSLFIKQTAAFSTLFKLQKKDFRAWANGLQDGGYSGDVQYSAKLIAIIQGLQLETYDTR